MKQTAVEWLFKNIWTNPPENLLEILDKAKEMEQQQQGYSKEEVLKAQQAILANIKDAMFNENYIIKYLEQFKKK
jgi:hypothetical protein